jgi:hypothetical protein
MRKLALGAVVIGLLAACGNSSFSGTDAVSTDDGGVGTDGAAAKDSGGGVMPGGGDASVPAKDAGPGGGPGKPGGSPTDGVFVSANSGDDTHNGTMTSPLKTLSAAMSLAKKLGKVVIACNETYTENLTVVDGVSLYGSYDCSNLSAWTASTKNAVLNAPQSPAVRADKIVAGATMGNIDIVAPSATLPEMSSVGVLVTASPGFELSQLKITVGDAQSGASQTEPTQLTDGANILAAGATGGANACGGYPGETGGNGGKYTEVCMDATAVKLPPHTKSTTSTGPKADFYTAGAVTNGTSSAGGTFSPSQGYVPGDGTAGTNGSGGHGTAGVNGTDYDKISDIDDGIIPNSGGKHNWSCMCAAHNFGASCATAAGTTTTTSLTAGAGGVAGGCPGLSGKAGTGGGSSIGIIAFDAPITLTNVSIKTGKGGDGGKGTAGSAPTAGGMPPTTAGSAPGISGSGTGGHSIGVAYKNTSGAGGTSAGPIFSKSPTKGTVTVGTAGAGVAAFSSADALRTVPATPGGAVADYYPIP